MIMGDIDHRLLFKVKKIRLNISNAVMYEITYAI